MLVTLRGERVKQGKESNELLRASLGTSYAHV